MALRNTSSEILEISSCIRSFSSWVVRGDGAQYTTLFKVRALYCFDESRISCEIHAWRQRSYHYSYQMILWQKHAVHQSTTPFQTERYSQPRQLAASFPFPAHAKNRKTLLPNHPIHWWTLYFFELQLYETFYHCHHLLQQGHYISSTYTTSVSCEFTVNTVTKFVTFDLQTHSMLII